MKKIIKEVLRLIKTWGLILVTMTTIFEITLFITNFQLNILLQLFVVLLNIS